jgi:hypothetical protein
MLTTLLVVGVLAAFAVAVIAIGGFLVTLWRIPDR